MIDNYNKLGVRIKLFGGGWTIRQPKLNASHVAVKKKSISSITVYILLTLFKIFRSSVIFFNKIIQPFTSGNFQSLGASFFLCSFLLKCSFSGLPICLVFCRPSFSILLDLLPYALSGSFLFRSFFSNVIGQLFGLTFSNIPPCLAQLPSFISSFAFPFFSFL